MAGMKWKIIAGTGHRPDKLHKGAPNVYAPDRHIRCFTLAERWVLAHAKEIDYVISGMAIGWDIALAEACVAANVPFKAFVPFKGQELKWPMHVQQQYQYLLGVAKEVRYTSEPGYTAKKMQIRNEAMVDACTHVLALWNGEESGGTWNCIKYARDKKKPIINLWEHFVGIP